MLIPDVLCKIFEYLDDRDEISGSPTPKTFRSLYSCLLVNRRWCESAVSVLWRSPFHRCHKRGGKVLVQTLLNCLNYEERQSLLEDGIYLPFNKSDCPIFDYPNFLKNLDYYQMVLFVRSWCRLLEDSDDQYVVAILRSLLRLFAGRSASLSALTIRSTGLDDDKYSLLAEPEILTLIKPIRHLAINCYFPKDTLLVALAKNCRNLHSIRINNLSAYDDIAIHTAKKLGTLIESQRGLKKIVFSRCKAFIGIVIPSLVKQKRTLKHIEFRGIDFEGCCKWDVLKSCTKLERLDIKECYNMDFNMISPLLKSHHRNLKKVWVYSCEPYEIGDELEAWADMINSRRRRRNSSSS
ncbi:7196_t:CDS:2 [Funneliformis caledonium]|uniref:7196_t:CDS:1 n=2 Tax=Funneliformis TaxID=1117308 RepID=A0A9N8VUR4_9GLOM|nr:8210_t:CDS:2 [Funneliformis mosseae]CAG8467079.1 7196_t:CDS:2 [Funneliformis caledonium]